MQDIQDFYILGLPIDTSIGKCHFVKVRDYPDFLVFQRLLLINKDKMMKIFKDNSDCDDEMLEIIKQTHELYDFIKMMPELDQLYNQLFQFVFKQSVYSKVDSSNFDYYRKLIMTMNCIEEEEVNPNPEIQAWIEKSRQFFNKDKVSFEDIASCVVAYTGHTYNDINEMTIYQLFMTFQRISAIIAYNTTTLFRTVSNDVNVESWAKHINLFEKRGYGVDNYKFGKVKEILKS